MKTNVETVPGLAEYRALLQGLNPDQLRLVLMHARLLKVRRWMMRLAVVIAAGVAILLAIWPQLAGAGVGVALSWSVVLAILSRPELSSRLLRIFLS